MVGTTISLLAISASAVQNSQTQDIKLAHLGGLVNSLAEKAGYKTCIANSLASRPVVYRLVPGANPKDLLRGLVKPLSLSIEFDEDKKKATVRYVPSNAYPTKQQRLSSTFSFLRNQFATFLNKEEQQRQDYLNELESLYKSSGDLAVSERYMRLHFKLRSLTKPSYNMALPMSLVVWPIESASNIISAPCAGTNRLPVSPASLGLLRRCLDATGDDQLAFEEPSGFSSFWSKLSEQDRMIFKKEIDRNRLSVLFDIYHEVRPETILIELRAITPYRHVPVGTLEFPLNDLDKARIPTQQEIEGGNRVFDMKSPFAFSKTLSINAFGNAAPIFNCNYIGWLSTATFFHEAPDRSRLNEIPSLRLKEPPDGMSAIRASRQGNWLSITDYLDPFPAYSADWKTFADLNDKLNANPFTVSELKEYLNGLDDRDLSNLELVSIDYPDLHTNYLGLTRGVRLVRAVNNGFDDLASRRTLRVSELHELAKKDVLGFFKSEYMRIVYPQFLHLVNAKRIMESMVSAEIIQRNSKPYLHVTIQFPEILTLGIELFYWRAPVVGHGWSMEFDVPLSPST